MGLFTDIGKSFNHSSQGTDKASILGTAAGFTPAGLAASIAADTINTPNTSRSGDISTGPATFGGITYNKGVPPWVWIAGLALAAVFILRR